MQRKPLVESLARYLERHPDERLRVDHVTQFVRANEDCFERACVPGHITASAWILAHDRASFLLTHHRKLGRWLQLGGHADGDPDPLAVALREAREESGMAEFEVAVGADGLPFDVDVHEIPARGAEPAHLHHDVRFLLIARPGQALQPSDESHALRWFPLATVPDLLDDDSQRRMARKAQLWLRSAR